jgi:hypothetical protein
MAVCLTDLLTRNNNMEEETIYKEQQNIQRRTRPDTKDELH